MGVLLESKITMGVLLESILLESTPWALLILGGLPYRAHQLTALVKKYLLKAGIEVGAACNGFRHSAATHMLESKITMGVFANRSTYLLFFAGYNNSFPTSYYSIACPARRPHYRLKGCLAINYHGCPVNWFKSRQKRRLENT